MDEFSFDTGQKDDWDGVCTTSQFTQSDSGRWRLTLGFTADDGDEVEMNLGIGKDWQSFDGGETVEKPGKPVFNDRTRYALFLKRAMGCGAEQELRKRSGESYGSQGPRHAALWSGLKFHFDVVNMPGDMPDPENPGGPWIPNPEGVNVVLPTKYLGVQGGSGGAPTQVGNALGTPSAAPSGATSSLGTSPAPAMTTENFAGNGITEADMTKLRALANEPGVNVIQDLAQKVMQDPTLFANGSVMNALSQPGFLDTLKSPI